MLSRTRTRTCWGTGSSAAPLSLCMCTHTPFPLPFTWKTLTSVRLSGQALFPEKNEVRLGRWELRVTPLTVSELSGVPRSWLRSRWWWWSGGRQLLQMSLTPACAALPASWTPLDVCPWRRWVSQWPCVLLEIPAQLELPLGDFA